VAGHEFRYSDSQMGQGLNETARSIAGLRTGMYVRIWLNNEQILRVDVCESR
jgi:hypothetical protein